MKPPPDFQKETSMKSPIRILFAALLLTVETKSSALAQSYKIGTCDWSIKM